MKILLIHQAFATLSQSGGTRHYEFGLHCVSKGHDFSVVTSRLGLHSGRPEGVFKGLVDTSTVAGIRVIRCAVIPTLHRSFVWRVTSFLSFSFISFLAGLRESVDVVLGTSPPLFQAGSAFALAVLKRKPFVLEIRDLWPEFAVDMDVLKNRFLIWASTRFVNFLYGRAHVIAVNSPAYKPYIEEHYEVSPDRVVLIPNGVDCSMFDPKDRAENLRQSLGLRNKTIVTYAGAMGPANNIDTILEAARLLSAKESVHFLLIGGGKERPRLESLAKRMELKNLSFLEPRPKSEITHLLAASDICIAALMNIPMFRMTYPNKVFDYMAAGRPIVLAIDGVIRELVEKAGAGIFVEPDNPQEMAEAVERLALSPQLRLEMGAQGRNYVTQHFDRRHQARAFEHMLREVSSTP